MVSLLYVLWCCAVLVTTATRPSLQAKYDMTVSSQRKVPKLISLDGQWNERVSGPVSYQNNTVHHHGHLSKRQTQSSTFLLIGNDRFILTLDLDGSYDSLGAPYNDSAANVVGVDFDYRNNHMFWSDFLRQQSLLRMSNFNGLGIRTLISSRITAPWDVAWDWINNKLYWTDNAEQEIEVYDLTNAYRRVLLYTGNTSAPIGIVVDPQNRWLYWTDASTSNPKIERASMDGTSRTVLHNTSLIFPSGITLDYTSQTLYWIDADRSRIESSAVDGSNRQVVTSTVNDNNPWGIVYYSGNLYWTDRNGNRSLIYTSSARFTSTRNLLSGFTLNFLPLGIEVVSSSRQLQGTNPCGSNNGGCQYICLLSSQASVGYTCACPDDLILASNGINCSTPTSGQLRLVQGNYTTSTLTSGRLEIYLNGQWGTVCEGSIFWGPVEADIACQQLGYTRAAGYGRSIDEGFAVGRGRIWLDDVVCSRSSSSLLSCSHNSIGVHDCSHNEDIALHCSRCTSSQFHCDNGECVPSSFRCNGISGGCSDGSDERGCSTCSSGAFRCSNGQCIISSGRCNGTRECTDGGDEIGCTCTSSQFRCASGECTSSAFRCNGLPGGCTDGSDERGCTVCTSGAFRCDNGQCIVSSGRCNGTQECTDGGDETGCTVNSGDLRLVRGLSTSTSYSSGRLEIYLNGLWGTVCDDGWDATNSDVACRQLGYVGAARPTSYRTSNNAGFEIGTGQIWLDDVDCQGSESRLTSCSNRGIGSHNCRHAEDVAIYCAGTRSAGGLSTGAVAGISVAVILIAVVVIVCCIVGCCCFVYRHNRSKMTTPSRPTHQPPVVQQQQEQQYTGYAGTPPYQQDFGVGGINPYPQQPPPPEHVQQGTYPQQHPPYPATEYPAGYPTEYPTGYPIEYFTGYPTGGPGYPLTPYPPSGQPCPDPNYKS